MDTAKLKIKQTVAKYIIDYPDEYQMLLEALTMRRKMIREGIDGAQGSDMMPMYELSEALQMLLTLALNEQEMTWWKERAGGRWFIRTFPQFSLQHGV